MKITAFAIAAAVLLPVAAEAAPRTTTVTARVSYADLDLSHPAGRATLEGRVKRAVRRLCPVPNAADLGHMSRSRECRKAAWTNAQRDMARLYDRHGFTAEFAAR